MSDFNEIANLFESDPQAPGDQPGVTVFPVPTAPAPKKKPGKEDYPALARSYAEKYGLDPDIFERQIKQESGFNPYARSPKGALGMSQFMPATGRRYGLVKSRDFLDPHKSLDAGARHMKDLVDQNGGDYDLALAAYNAGQSAVDKHGGVPPYRETRAYIKAIRGTHPAPTVKPPDIANLFEPDSVSAAPSIAHLFEPDPQANPSQLPTVASGLTAVAPAAPTATAFPAEMTPGAVQPPQSPAQQPQSAQPGIYDLFSDILGLSPESQQPPPGLEPIEAGPGEPPPDFSAQIPDLGAPGQPPLPRATKPALRDIPTLKQSLAAKQADLKRQAFVAKYGGPQHQQEYEQAVADYNGDVKTYNGLLKRHQQHAAAPAPSPELLDRAAGDISDFEAIRKQAVDLRAQGDDLHATFALRQAFDKAAQIRDRYGKHVEVGTGEGGWPYIKPVGWGFAQAGKPATGFAPEAQARGAQIGKQAAYPQASSRFYEPTGKIIEGQASAPAEHTAEIGQYEFGLSEANDRAANRYYRAQTQKKLGEEEDARHGVIANAIRHGVQNVLAGAGETATAIGGAAGAVLGKSPLGLLVKAIRPETGEEADTFRKEMLDAAEETRNRNAPESFVGAALYQAGRLLPKLAVPGGVVGFGVAEAADAIGHDESPAIAVKRGLTAIATGQLGGMLGKAITGASTNPIRAYFSRAAGYGVAPAAVTAATEAKLPDSQQLTRDMVFGMVFAFHGSKWHADLDPINPPRWFDPVIDEGVRQQREAGMSPSEAERFVQNAYKDSINRSREAGISPKDTKASMRDLVKEVKQAIVERESGKSAPSTEVAPRETPEARQQRMLGTGEEPPEAVDLRAVEPLPKPPKGGGAPQIIPLQEGEIVTRAEQAFKPEGKLREALQAKGFDDTAIDKMSAEDARQAIWGAPQETQAAKHGESAKIAAVEASPAPILTAKGEGADAETVRGNQEELRGTRRTGKESQGDRRPDVYQEGRGRIAVVESEGATERLTEKPEEALAPIEKPPVKEAATEKPRFETYKAGDRVQHSDLAAGKPLRVIAVSSNGRNLVLKRDDGKGKPIRLLADSPTAKGFQRVTEAEAEPIEKPAHAQSAVSTKEAAIVSQEPARVQGVEGIVKREREEKRKIEAEAATDNLTGLQNQNQWKAAQPRIDADPNLHIARLDINRLKAVNDTHGHQAGDAYIEQAGKIIGEEATKAGVSPRMQFRSGTGDEFTLAGDQKAVTEAAKAIQTRIASEVKLPDGSTGSIAYGVARREKAADALMYAQKKSVKSATSSETTKAAPIAKTATGPIEEKPAESGPVAKRPTRAEAIRLAQEAAARKIERREATKRQAQEKTGAAKERRVAEKPAPNENPKNATPIKVYRGTAEPTAKMPRVHPEGTGDYEGIYFTQDPKAAKRWATWKGQRGETEGHVAEYQVEIKNPARYKDVSAARKSVESNFGDNYTRRNLTDELKRRGFDGVIDDSYKGNEIVVFNEDQVRKPLAGLTKTPSRVTKSPTAESRRKLVESLNDDDLWGESGQASLTPRGWQIAETTLKDARESDQALFTLDGDYLASNAAAVQMLSRAYGKTVRGITFTAPQAMRIVGNAAKLAARATSPAERDNLRALAMALADAARNNEEFGIGRPRSLFHEVGHVAQLALKRFFGRDITPEDAQALPEYRIGEKGLRDKGYVWFTDPRVFAHEAYAHIAGGQWAEIGMNIAQAARFVEGYYKLIAKTYRADALKRFNRLDKFMENLHARVYEETRRAEAGQHTGTTAGVIQSSAGRPGGDYQAPDEAAADREAREDLTRQTETPEFKRWFGASKVVDEQGKPLVVYHGTMQNFSQFSDEDIPYRGGILAFFSTSPRFASEYAADARGANVLPVYLKIDEPFDYRSDWRMAREFYEDTGGLTNGFDIQKILIGLGKDEGERDYGDFNLEDLSAEEFTDLVKRGSWDAIEASEFVEWLRGAGYDGIVTFENEATNYAVFEPEQIKSATGNRGAFDPHDPDILADLAAIPLPPRVVSALVEITRSFIESGETDFDVLMNEIEDAVSADKFGRISPHLAEIIGAVYDRIEAAEQEQYEANARKADSPAETDQRQRLYPPRPTSQPTSEGAATSVSVPGTLRTYAAQYQTRELTDVYPSHNPQTFQPNPDYELVNDRRYDREKSYQEDIIKNSRPDTFIPKRLINNSDTAESGPPIIDQNGNVLGGNSRTMKLARIYAAGAGRDYKAELLKQANVYGLDVKQLAAMKQPVLVRLITDETLSKQDAVTELNVSGTRALAPTERAAAEANRMPDETVDYIADKIEQAGDDATLAQVLDRSGVEIANRLITDGVFATQERNALINDKGLLPEARKRIERMMQGRIYRDLEQLERAPDSIKRNTERIIAPLLRIEDLPEWSLNEDLRYAIDLATEARAAGTPNLEEFARQPSMFRAHEYDPREVALAEALSLGPVKTAKAFRQYANEAILAQNGGGLFGGATPEQAFKDAFGLKESRHVASGGTNLERGGEGRAGDQLREAPVSAQPGTTERPAGPGSERTTTTGPLPESGQGVSGSRAAPGRAPGNREVRQEEPRPAAGTAGSQQPARSRDAGEPITPIDHTPTARVRELAQGDQLADKRKAQIAANRITVTPADLDNIRATLPFLKPAQQEDVLKAEKRFAKPDGYGMLFTNSTGTGKTYTGLGVIRRFVSQGKDSILVVAPSDNIMQDWIASGENLGLDIRMLESTQDNGKSGVVVTTYANFGANNSLARRKWDLIVADEAHNLSQNKEGDLTLPGEALRAITLHPDGFYTRSRMLLPELHSAIDAARHAKDDKEQRRLYEELRKQEEPIRAEIERAKTDPASRPRVAMLSATPFAYRKNVRYAQGFLFDWNIGHVESGGYNAPSAYEAFMIRHFGYRMRTGKLNEPDAEVNTAIMEQQFNAYLKKEGVLSGRALDVEPDYDRKFVLAEDAIGTKIDEGMKFLREAHDHKYSPLSQLLHASFKYHDRMYLLESLRARQVVPLIKKHLALGRKVVVFHDFNKGGGFHPFQFKRTNAEVTHYVAGKPVTVKVNDLIDDFERERPDLVGLDFSGLRSPIEAMRAAFPEALFINGLESKQYRRDAKALFNDDNKGHDLIVVQSDAGATGLSLHDTTGKHPRVLFNLGMPVKPTAATQIEGRIYRVGQVSDAVLRYLTTGTNWERWTFASTIAERAGTAENLAMGEDARTLKQSIIDAYLDPIANYEPSLDEGKGGKETDRARTEALSDFERAKTFYFGQQKKTSRNKSAEGTDYFATPEPLGLKMVEWSGIRRGEKILEPSAGHGAIARFFPEDADRTIIEPSQELATRAALVAGGAQMIPDRFEEHHIVNKYDAIVMNPPFGQGGKTAIDHLDKATTHLRDGGRIVALIPEGPAADKRLEKFLYGDDRTEGVKNVYKVADIHLPAVTFERAGTGVKTHIVVLERQDDKERAARLQQVERDLSDADSIKELFDRIENMSVPERLAKPEPEETAPQASVEPAGGGIQTVAEMPASGGANFKLGQFRHTTQGHTVYAATLSTRVDAVDYGTVNATAKRWGGYYSKFKGAGAIPGFLFKTEAARAQFLQAANAMLSPGEEPFADLAPSDEEESQSVKVHTSSPSARLSVIARKSKSAPVPAPLTGSLTAGVKAGWDKFLNLAVRNLSHLRRVSPTAQTAALRSAGSRGQATVLLQLATAKIAAALEGSGLNWQDLRASLVESRLRGIRERYEGFAQEAYLADDEELKTLMRDGLTDILGQIEGRAGLDDTLAQSAAAMLEHEDLDSLREFVGAAFEAAAERVGQALTPEDYTHITTNPRFTEGLRLYRDLIEQPIAESHAINEGIFSDALGPLDTYYPLVAVKDDGGILHRIFGVGKYPYRKPKNIANAFATGLAAHGYSTEAADFGERITAAIRTNNKANLMSELDRQGLIRVLGPKEKAPDEETLSGEYGPVVTVETRADLIVLRDGKQTRVPAARAIVPAWLHKELKPILERERLEPGMGASLINKIIHISLIGPLDLVFHSTNVVGTLVANTPFVGQGLIGKTIGNLPFTKIATAMLEMVRVEPLTGPMTERTITDLTEMANLGLIPPRYGSRTISSKFIELTGAKRGFSSAFLYGPKGLDIRARLVMYRVAKMIEPNATPQSLFDFVTQLGVYNRELESLIERWAKGSRLAPFATAGMSMLRNGINAWVGLSGSQPIPVGGSGNGGIGSGNGGKGPGGGGIGSDNAQNVPGGSGKRFAYRIAQTLSGGAAGLLLLWAAAYREYKKKYPWQDPEARLLQFPLNPEDRNSKLGRMLFGDDPTKTAYVSLAFFSPLVARGGRALGLQGAFETRQLGGTAGQSLEYAQRDIYNSIAHPFTSGPLVRAPFVFLTGKEPQITSLRDITGQFGPELYPATIKAAPGLSTLRQRAQEAILNVNPFFQAAAGAAGIGKESERKPGEKEVRAGAEGAILDRIVPRILKGALNLAAPRLLGSAVDTLARQERLEKERKAAESTARPKVNLPDDVRKAIHDEGVIPNAPNRKPDESDEDYKVRAAKSNEAVADRVRSLLQSDAYKGLDAPQRKQAIKDIIEDAHRDASTGRIPAAGAETELQVEQRLVQDRILDSVKAREDFKALSKEGQESVTRGVSMLLERFDITTRDRKALDDGQRSEKARILIERLHERGAFDQEIERLILRAQRKAA